MKILTARDACVALLAVTATCVVLGATGQAKPILTSTVFDWNAIEVRETKVGSSRQVVRAPTATLDELEMHITTLNPGQTSHAPHQHPNEELLIIKEGTVEALVNGEWKKLGVGFNHFSGVEPAARHPERRYGTDDLSRHQLELTGDAEEAVASGVHRRKFSTNNRATSRLISASVTGRPF